MLRASLLLLWWILTGCNPAPGSTSTLTLQLRVNDKPLSCDSVFSLTDEAVSLTDKAISQAGRVWQLQQFQLYVSNFRLNNRPLLLDTAALHQQADIALLGTVCDGADNWQLQFATPLAAGQLSFTLGVPAVLNHQDPLRAAAPLNQSDMFWSWQQGYKYLRLDIHSTAQPAQQWSLHLGATGCRSASPMRAPEADCNKPNRVTINLDYLPGQQLILDLAPILAGVNLSADNHCMSDPNRLSCQTLLPRLGIGALPQGWSMQ
ncbi:MbnP family copper-binding protein [Rheinheimera sp.]|uniref:MbnP family copper-binding protein n=1 Tax=Rheinheimera sp. TaxID=1869214 RepID=UPI0027345BDB|nr:MbnP family copper-binding protein [Rheinheimera sp.]MDP2715032.1 metallo-mystery pair system four-Cys motif protein [Rheinheimera sp.]